MLKSELEEELKKASAENERTKRAFLAVREIIRRASNNLIEIPLNEEARTAYQNGIIDILSSLFELDQQSGSVIGFNTSEIDYYIWLSEEPERKKA